LTYSVLAKVDDHLSLLHLIDFLLPPNYSSNAIIMEERQLSRGDGLDDWPSPQLHLSHSA
jgi:hypothetical protein